MFTLSAQPSSPFTLCVSHYQHISLISYLLLFVFTLDAPTYYLARTKRNETNRRIKNSTRSNYLELCGAR